MLEVPDTRQNLCDRKGWQSDARTTDLSPWATESDSQVSRAPLFALSSVGPLSQHRGLALAASWKAVSVRLAAINRYICSLGGFPVDLPLKHNGDLSSHRALNVKTECGSEGTSQQMQ